MIASLGWLVASSSSSSSSSSLLNLQFAPILHQFCLAHLILLRLVRRRRRKKDDDEEHKEKMIKFIAGKL